MRDENRNAQHYQASIKPEPEVNVALCRFMFIRGYDFACGKIPGGVGAGDSIVHDAIEDWKAEQAEGDDNGRP